MQITCAQEAGTIVTSNMCRFSLAISNCVMRRCSCSVQKRNMSAFYQRVLLEVPVIKIML